MARLARCGVDRLCGPRGGSGGGRGARSGSGAGLRGGASGPHSSPGCRLDASPRRARGRGRSSRRAGEPLRDLRGARLRRLPDPLLERGRYRGGVRGLRRLRAAGRSLRPPRGDPQQLGILRGRARGLHLRASHRGVLREMGSGRHRVALVLGLLLLLFACRSAPPRLVEVEPGSAGAQRVVVAPMNLTVPLGSDLEDAVEPVTWELVRYLQAHGARVAVIFAPDASALWRDVEEALAKRAGSTPPVEVTASAFARAVAAESPFDLLVLPSLVYRSAAVGGRVATWAGVRRRIRLTLEPSAVAPKAVQPAEDRIETPGVRSFRGKISGLSLHGLVLTADGKIVFHRFGGLDLVHDVREGEGPKESVLRLQTKPLGDADHVREGIAVALDPYLVTHADTR